MINELYQLSVAMKQAGLAPQNWHREYKPIPNASEKAPCIKLTIDGDRLSDIDSVPPEQAALLRKYGTNHQSFPCLNLVPLYRVTDEAAKKCIAALTPERLDEEMLAQLEAWCTTSNWTHNFCLKYKRSMTVVPKELTDKLKHTPFPALETLIRNASVFADPQFLHSEMKRVAFDMLKHKTNIRLALQVLIHPGNAEKTAKDDTGKLSVALESECLVQQGMPVVSNRFVTECNRFLLAADAAVNADKACTLTDAFGKTFAPLEEPMPSVKLAGGFDTTLRTMFKAQHCQHRYGAIENASYPISPEMRLELQAALAWLGSNEHKNVYWLNTDKNEILFAYPHTLTNRAFSHVGMFRRSDKTTFQTAAQEFLKSVATLQPSVIEGLSDRIQLFILRKITKGQTKVVYTRITSPKEFEQRSADWITGCRENLPTFLFKQPDVPFPLEAADILNRAWKQDGTIATERFQPVPKYRGLELLLDRDAPPIQDLHMLVKSCTCIAPYLGSNRNTDLSHMLWKVKQQLALLGFLLYRMGIRKEQYMNSFPYQYGQLLKAADELHMLYCNVVRKGDMPTQLVGSGMYHAAAEAPIRTLNMLSQRTLPYLTWAKTYRNKGETEPQKESWRAGWLCSVMEGIANRLGAAWTAETRLNEEDKAQMFLGYLATLPRNAKQEEAETDNSDE